MRNSLLFFTAAAIITGTLIVTGGKKPGVSDAYIYTNLSRGNVKFPHEQHYRWGIGCLSCHHRYKSGINILDINELKPGTTGLACAICHEPGMELESAYHRMCIDCHEKMLKESSSTGPVMCGHCHTAKEKN